jgi:hypothetical protein
MRRDVPKKNRDATAILRKIFKIRESRKKRDGRHKGVIGRITFIAVAVVFAFILGFIFDRNLWRLYNAGGDLPGAIEGMFTILMSLTFAIIGVYLVVHVLHPHFGKMPLPNKLKEVFKEERFHEDMTREELTDIVEELGSNDEVKAYIDTFSVKSDIAFTLAMSLVAFFAGMYGYMTSITIGYDSSPNIFSVSACLTIIIFSNVYMILKTMKVVWDV